MKRFYSLENICRKIQTDKQVQVCLNIKIKLIDFKNKTLQKETLVSGKNTITIEYIHFCKQVDAC